MNRVPSGLPEDRFFDLSSHFKVLKHESSIKDEDPNERIQREGAHFGGGADLEQPLLGAEAEWYVKHKGYSEKI